MRPSPVPALLWLAASCATAQAPPSLRVGPSPSTPAGPALSVRMDALTTGSMTARPVRRGETLHTGDRIALSVQVDQAAYVYALHYSGKGWSQLLSPSTKEQPLGPTAPLRVPAGELRLTLDEE